uniref:KasB n=1 Tax=Mycolicibacterium aurum TaxID=1791 RepID=Q2XPY8_MYCAU|nr:KasB [Mycolicibacterium aurum]
MAGVKGLSTGNGFPNVVVTGYTMTTALATDADTTWRKLLDGESGIRTLTDPFVEEYDLPVRIGGRLLEDFDDELTRVELRRLSYLQKMSTVLSRRVWEHAGNPDVDPKRLMVSIGTGMGSTEQLLFACEGMKAKGLRAVSPLAVQMYMPNAAAAAVGLERKARAGVITPVSACASGSEGVAQAWRNIVLGEADVAICGGVETRIEAVPIAGFAQMRIVLSTTNDDPPGACKPFDKDRNGFVFGEGGALMVIETEEHAKARGATIMPRLMGASITSDGYHIVAPDPNGEQAGYAMTRAIQLAGLQPSDIDHINAHATGTSVGDVAESKAIRNAIGDHQPAVYAPKAPLGHSVGAVGAVEVQSSPSSPFARASIPPTRNLEEPRPGDRTSTVVAGSPRPGNYEYAINNSFGFGGHNVALAFGKY